MSDPAATPRSGIELNAATESRSCTASGYDVDSSRQLWPTDNEWGVPVLRLDRQATAITIPFTCWGREARKSRMRGTWHYYTSDERFATVWKRPHHVINSGAIAAVECNYSVHPQMPRAQALYRTYKKRWLARTWQEWGIRTFVDLNVALEHADLNLLGIPKGWRAFATRGSVHRLEDLDRELDLARTLAGDRGVLFVVYGGGKAVAEWCRRECVQWFPEEQEKARR